MEAAPALGYHVPVQACNACNICDACYPRAETCHIARSAQGSAMMQFFRKGWLHRLLISIRSSLWFVPSLMVLGAVVLALGLIEIDQRFDALLGERFPKLLTNEAEGARGVLNAIAGSMATVAGVVFSITIVALSLASTQYTSRVLRNFMRDRANQMVLGVFVGVYIYCLLVLRTVSDSDYEFVPSLSVLMAVVLAIVAIGFFIFFIHHTSSSIQASEIAASIAQETLNAIDRLFPDQLGQGSEREPEGALPEGTRWHPVPALSMGYIQGVEPEGLLDFAKKHSTVVRMECAIGEFIAPPRRLVSLALARQPDDALIDEVNQLYAVGSYRTIEQDAAFGIRQLVDIALKALSPGVNDTTTAVTCIEHLSALLARCARRSLAAAFRYDGDRLLVVARTTSFAELVDLSYSQILENAGGNTEVMLRLLLALEQIAHATDNRERLGVLRQHVRAVEDASRRSISTSAMLDRIQHMAARAHAAIDGEPPPEKPPSHGIAL